jgi:ABC-type antimicrobial peptide transport system permease subunit
VRAAIAGIDRDLALADVQPMTAVIERTLGGHRFPALLALLFAVSAMTLGAIGVTGVLSSDVASRRREIGVRLALGAAPGRIERAVIGRGLTLAGAGVLIGLVAALGGARVLQSMLFGVSPTDPMTFAMVGVLFAILMVAASWSPARRAARVDPLRTLRGE